MMAVVVVVVAVVGDGGCDGGSVVDGELCFLLKIRQPQAGGFSQVKAQKM